MDASTQTMQPKSRHETPRSSCRPLSGLVVVEIGSNVAAPVTGQILGDLGAEVIKVEKPDGDPARGWGPPFYEGAAAVFQALNRNKRSVVVDFRDADAVVALAAFIVAKADIVVQNMRPGSLSRHGLDGSQIRDQRPELIWCDMGAFGHVGPLSDRPGYDPLMQAFGGLMSVTGEAGGNPVRTGYSVIDMGTGLWAAVGILAALHERKITGNGSRVDVSLFETALAWMGVSASQCWASGEVPARHGSGAAMIVPYRAYATLDGNVVIAAGSDGLFARLAAALGHPEWVRDPMFANNADRVRHRERLDGLIAERVAVRPTQDWIGTLEAAGVPVAAVQNLKEALRHSQTEALSIIQNVPGSGFPLLGLPVSFDGARPTARSAAPSLGADTCAVLNLSEGESLETLP